MCRDLTFHKRYAMIRQLKVISDTKIKINMHTCIPFIMRIPRFFPLDVLVQVKSFV